MKMNAPLCAGIAISFLLLSPIASRGEPRSIAGEFEDPQGREDSGALREMVELMMDHYTPALKTRILSLEKKVKGMTRFSGSIYLKGEEALSAPKISGEAAVSNEEDVKQPLVNWSIRTSLDFDSGGVGMELWKETGFARISFSNEVEQDFSDDFEYKSLIMLEKRF